MTDYSWRVGDDDLDERLRARLAGHTAGVEITLVALPGGSACRLAPTLAQRAGAHYLHFDKELIQALDADGWERWVRITERRPANRVATTPIGFARVWQPLRDRIVDGVTPGQPLLVGEPNLAVAFGLDLVGELKRAMAGRRGHLVLAGTATVDEGRVFRWNGVLEQSTIGAVVFQLAPQW